MNERAAITNLMGVKRLVAEVNGPRHRFRVLESGDSRFYLFYAMTPDGVDCGWNGIPVRKADLQPDVRSALTNGWGHGPHPLSRRGPRAHP